MIKTTISTALLDYMKEELEREGLDGYWHDKFITAKTFDEYVVSRATKEGIKHEAWFHYFKEDKDFVAMHHLATQADFEPGVGNCTLAAITSMLTHLQKTEPHATYNRVKSIARFFLYTKNTGTPPMFVSPIVKLAAYTKLKVIQSLSLGKTACYKGYRQPLKDFFQALKVRLGTSQIPAIITIKNASYGRYKMHSMLVVGVREIAIPSSDGVLLLQFLAVHDGWKDEVIYLPADELGIFHLLEFEVK